MQFRSSAVAAVSAAIGALVFIALANSFRESAIQVVDEVEGVPNSPSPVTENVPETKTSRVDQSVVDDGVAGGRSLPLAVAPRGNPLGAKDASRILSQIDQLVSSIALSQESCDDLRIYMLDQRTLVKAIEARRRLIESEFKIMSKEQQSLLRETPDLTYLAFGSSVGRVVFEFRRERDGELFALIDQHKEAQQEDWSQAAEDFNSRDEAVRELAITAHRQAREEMAKLNESFRGLTPDQRARAYRSRKSEIAKIQAALLPVFLIVPPTGNTVWARKSIGR